MSRLIAPGFLRLPLLLVVLHDSHRKKKDVISENHSCQLPGSWRAAVLSPPVHSTKITAATIFGPQIQKIGLISSPNFSAISSSEKLSIDFPLSMTRSLRQLWDGSDINEFHGPLIFHFPEFQGAAAPRDQRSKAHRPVRAPLTKIAIVSGLIEKSTGNHGFYHDAGSDGCLYRETMRC